MRNQRRVFFTQTLAAPLTRGRVRRFQNLGDFRIRHTRMRKNHALIKTKIRHFAGAAQVHLADHYQTIDLRLERTQPVGQHLRQHRHHRPGEIDRVTTILRLQIQRRIRFHIMRNVSNRHKQLGGAARALFTIHRVVKVFGVLTIDGDKRQFTQIHTPGQICLRNILG